jgi:galactonate dehydratase
MRRRSFLHCSAGMAGLMARPQASPAAAPGNLKITRVRFYRNPASSSFLNQSAHIVTVETDQGITGVGEGGTREIVEQCAGVVIGEDPFRTEHLWQLMFRAHFYPAGREKLDALGALDMAFWDIKGKALGVPVCDLLGGRTRDHLECYAGLGRGENIQERARACKEAGFRACRFSLYNIEGNEPFNSHAMVRKAHHQCTQVREGVGPDGDWALDFHTRLDMSDAVRLSTLIEPLEPYFAEDLVRSEDPGVYRELRKLVKVPISVGEQFGARWDLNELVEQHLIDYARVTLPNVGGITEYMKIAALCETHYVGLMPHFTGHVAYAALVNCCAAFSGPVLVEMGGPGPQKQAHLPLSFDFRNGKLWPNRRPGLGVELDTKPLQLVSEFSERAAGVKVPRRPDGSFLNQ